VGNQWGNNPVAFTNQLSGALAQTIASASAPPGSTSGGGGGGGGGGSGW
jgi:hypothetical protein